MGRGEAVSVQQPPAQPSKANNIWPALPRLTALDPIVNSQQQVTAMARKQYPLRIDPAIWEAVQRWADDEMRSANGQVEWILRDALKRAGRLPKKGAADTPKPPKSQ